VGWFLIACVCSFLGYWGWRSVANRSGRTAFILAIIIFLLIMTGLPLWAYLSRNARSAGEVIDALQDGSVVRFILGVILGIGAARIVTQGSHIGSDNRNGRELPTSQPTVDARSLAVLLLDAYVALSMADQSNGGVKPGSTASAEAPKISRCDTPPTANGTNGIGQQSSPSVASTPLVLSLGLGILILALVAPYIDDWLHRLTAVKSPWIELQLAGFNTHRIAVADGLGSFFNENSLEYLQKYASKIQTDIEYFDKYGQDDKNQAKIVKTARELLPTFNGIVSPVTACVQTAINKNWLSVTRARLTVLPSADLVGQIILDENLSPSDQLKRSKDFWAGITKLPETIRSLVGAPTSISDPACRDVVTPASSFPIWREYKNLPYLYAAAALLISFTGDSDKALRVLQKADDPRDTAGGGPGLYFKDYSFLSMAGRLKYYQGKPGDVAHSYLGDLDALRTQSLEHAKKTDAAKLECVSVESLPCRERTNRLDATNMAAYFLAEDLARGSAYAAHHTAQLRELAEEIKRTTDEVDRIGSGTNGFYTYVQSNEDSLHDTYAYAILVLEAQKPNPDYDLIRKEVVTRLRRVIEHLEESIENEHPVKTFDLATLRITQAHLASARDMVGER
jgi:hypothetical protein